MSRLSRFFFRHAHAKALEEQLEELVSRVESYEQAFAWAAEEDILKKKETEKKKFKQMESDIESIKDLLMDTTMAVKKKRLFTSPGLTLVPGQYKYFIQAVFDGEIELSPEIAATVEKLDKEIDKFRAAIGAQRSMSMSDLDCLSAMDEGVEY